MDDQTLKKVIRQVNSIRSMQNELFVFLLIAEETGTLSVLEPHFMGTHQRIYFRIKGLQKKLIYRGHVDKIYSNIQNQKIFTKASL